MAYTFLEDTAIADIAFEATGTTLEELFRSAAEATVNTMIENPVSIAPAQRRDLSITAESIELLLFDFLQEFVYYKDAESLLLRVDVLKIDSATCSLASTLRGETLNPEVHLQRVDVKAVTLHRFKVTKTDSGWQGFVILDV